MDVEWLILADAAQVVGNKLYLLGGGWDVLRAEAGFPVPQHCAVAASFAVPWSETNQQHAVQIEFITEDGQVLARVDSHFEVGRPPGIVPGQPQRVQLAAEMVLTLEQPGTYVVVARTAGREGRRVQFTVR